MQHHHLPQLRNNNRNNNQTMTIILKQNTESIRDRIEEAGIHLCPCTRFKDACWLDYHVGLTSLVHGVGYYDEELDCVKSQEEELARYVREVKDPYYCKDVKAFIEKILETKKK
jgi:hypothetical protein